MKIWVIGRSYPIKQNKMRGTFELEQAQLLERGGNQVSYIAAIFHPVNKVKKWGYCTFEDENVKVYLNSVFFAPERMHIHLPKFQGWVWKRLLKKVEKERGVPDIIHIHYPGMVSIPEIVLGFQKRGTKIVITDHWSQTLNDSMDKFQRKQLIEYVNKADKILCVSEPLKNSIKKISKTTKEINIVPNMVSSKFSFIDSCSKDSEYNFIVVGRLAPVKRIEQIVYAFSKAFANNNNVKLIIVGEGNERKKIERIVKAKNIEKRVTMTGTLSREKVAELINRADALVCYSKWETFGVPVIEAWACGKPVVVSNAVGCIENWSEELGYVVSRDNIEELTNAMWQIYQNRKFYSGKNISMFAKSNFGEQAVYQKLMDIYLSMQISL